MSNRNYSNNTSEVMTEFLRIAADNSDVSYGVDTGGDTTGEELIEKAHPETAEIIESYVEDAGVVENQTQQQEVGIEIANKMPDNHVSRKVMATKNLVDELAIIAEEMNVRGEEDFAKFADSIIKNIHKEGAVPLALIGGIGAGIVTILSAYFYAVHGTEPINYGTGKNLESVYYAIANYKSEKLSEFGSETDTDIARILTDTQNLIVNIYNSRKAYLEATKTYANELQDFGKKEIDSTVVKTIMDNPTAKATIDKINSINERYNEYISRRALPMLIRDYKYLDKYFQATKGYVGTEKSERSTLEQVWEKVTGVAGLAQKSSEEHVLDSLEMAIKSLRNDIILRKMEKDRLIQKLSRPIQMDISKEFDANAPVFSGMTLEDNAIFPPK